MSELNVREILEKLPCIQNCNKGVVVNADGDAEGPCEYCHKIKFPFIDKAVSEILQAFRDKVNECGPFKNKHHDNDFDRELEYEYKEAVSKQELLSLLEEQKGGRG